MADKTVVSFLRDADDVVHMLTGKHLNQLAKKGLEMFGENIERKLISEREVAEPGSPYALLDVRPDAADIVVRAKYRILKKALEKMPDELEKLEKAYKQIAQEREW